MRCRHTRGSAEGSHRVRRRALHGNQAVHAPRLGGGAAVGIRRRLWTAAAPGGRGAKGGQLLQGGGGNMEAAACNRAGMGPETEEWRQDIRTRTAGEKGGRWA